MTLNQIKSFKWTDKIHLKRGTGYIIGLSVAVFILYFRLRPYFVVNLVIKPYSREKNYQQQSGKNAGENEKLKENRNTKNTGAGKTVSNPLHPSEIKNRIIERPLFDGRLVTLKAVLLQNISSRDSGGEIEAKLLQDGDLVGSFDTSLLDGGLLIGTAAPNFESKKYELRFSQLVSQVGRRYGVSAFAVDDATQLSGILALYSSGLGARLAGAALNRAVEVGEDIATARIIDGTGTSGTVAAEETNRAITDTGHQGGNELSDEATKSLRNTRPELSLPAGTVFTLKLRASDQSPRAGQ